MRVSWTIRMLGSMVHKYDIRMMLGEPDKGGLSLEE